MNERVWWGFPLGYSAGSYPNQIITPQAWGYQRAGNKMIGTQPSIARASSYKGHLTLTLLSGYGLSAVLSSAASADTRRSAPPSTAARAAKQAAAKNAAW